MVISYDDAYNVANPNLYRCSYGFLLKEKDEKLLEKFKDKLGFEWTWLPETMCLSGEFPYRNASSLTFAGTRFLPTCYSYIYRNQKKLQELLKDENKCGTIELIDGSTLTYYIPMENFKEFYLTKAE